MAKLAPEFEKLTGIKVEYELLNHFDVISKGQADILSGRGHYDGVMMHSFQLGPMIDAGAVRDITGYMANAKLTNPDLGLDDLINPAYDTTAKYKGKQYGFLNWNYNSIYWARNDLLSHADEKSAFKAKYNYDLAPAKTMQQMRDIAEFFTRKKGEKLAGQVLKTDFYGIVMEGIKGGTTFPGVWYNFLKNWGGGIVGQRRQTCFQYTRKYCRFKILGEFMEVLTPRSG